MYDVLRFAKSVATVCGVMLVSRLTIGAYYIYTRPPLSIILMLGAFSFLGMVGLRFGRRWIYETAGRGLAPAAEPERVLIIGAGEYGKIVAREIRLRPDLNLTLVGFVDDDPAKQHLEVEGKRVLGRLDDIATLHKRFAFTKALLAIVSLPVARKRFVVHACSRLGVRLLTLPGTSELISGRAKIERIREVQIEDLLGRPVRQLTRDDPLLQPVYGNKRILVTGAGGSIGSELCRQVARLSPAKIILVEKDETNLFNIYSELREFFPEIPTVPVLLDITALDKVRRAWQIHEPQVVLHAAAYKHVPLMEENPGEAIENNILGTRNVAEASRDYGAEVFVMLSTDKAVNPTSIMGATKRVSELLVRQIAETSQKTKFGSVRFGNVLGSRGSVIPIFREQIARGGPVTVTHPEVTRYFMTIPEASQLVLKAGTLANKGEIFVLDMGEPVRILDLAKDMIRLSGFSEDEIEIRFIGLRPGEKLYEELLVDRDTTLPTPVEKVFVAKPELRDFRIFREQVERLIELAKTNSFAAIRKALMDMDIGMRLPDAEHETYRGYKVRG